MRQELRRSAYGLTTALTLAFWGLPSRSAAQDRPSVAVAAAISGRVIDAATSGPVPDALVTLEPSPLGLLLDPMSGLAVGARVVVTGASGAYRFIDLAAGRYRIHIERLGYRSAAVDVEVRHPVDVRLSLGLEMDPVRLDPVEVEGRAAPLFERVANRSSEPEETRPYAERARQALFVTPDARMLTYADVMDGVTLGEGDVFRALQRFPGVGTRDDYSAEIWTRGAPWTHTRVTFDGVPLFNPVHAVGVLSAVSPEVLGAVFFHPGVQPASQSDGAAGVVDLRSRPGGGQGKVRGVADLSVASAKIALDQNVVGRGSWVVAARRSHVDLLSSGLGWIGLDSLDLPYVFQDVAGRVDLILGPARLEASGLWEEDRLDGDVQGVLERTEARWGNAAGRVALRVPVGGVELSQTVSLSRFTARTDERLVRVRGPAPGWTESESLNEIGYLKVDGELAPGDASTVRAWSFGYLATWQDVDYDGPWPRYHAAKPDTIRRLSYERALWTAGVWGEGRFTLGERVTVNPGLRLETGGNVTGPRVRAAPRVALRYAISPDHSVSLAAGRSWQLTQAIALGGPSIHPAFHASHFWVLADRETPAIRSDLLTLGSEHWLGAGWLGSATLYLRQAKGIAVPDPTPGALIDRHRPLFVLGRNDARGVELGLRRIGARWSTSSAYGWAVSEVAAGGRRYPAPADRRHLFDAMVSVRAQGGVRLAAAYTTMSGAPFTRAISASAADCTAFGFGCGTSTVTLQDPNAERTPAYRSLSASVHWAREVGPVEIGGYVQIRNLLGRDNASTYAGSIPIGRAVFDDRFEQGLARVPLLGLRVTF